ncbi:hypothetical protein QYF36_011073 [Acer negundo]|nr:hypothetical protein QYF36_011073 [Acer negundo]
MHEQKLVLPPHNLPPNNYNLKSYYRCTNSKCTVKKRVERSSEDSTVVITTYEGQHRHHTVGFPRGGVLNHEAAFAGDHVKWMKTANMQPEKHGQAR